MKKLNLQQIGEMIALQSTQRDKKESLLSIMNKNIDKYIIIIWMFILLFILGIMSLYLIQHEWFPFKLLIICIVILLIISYVLYKILSQRKLVHKFNYSPEFFDNTIQDLAVLKDSYHLKISKTEKKSNNLIGEKNEVRYYKDELIPYYYSLIASIHKNITWCEEQRIQAMRRRDGVKEMK